MFKLEKQSDKAVLTIYGYVGGYYLDFRAVNAALEDITKSGFSIDIGSSNAILKRIYSTPEEIAKGMPISLNRSTILLNSSKGTTS